MKKTFALILVAVMLFSLGMTAFADETKGTITIDNAVVGQTYTIYRILDLESYNATAGTYAYKANSAWKTWLKTQTTYVTFDAQDYVTWVSGADVNAFAKAAIAYAKTSDSGISNSGSTKATTTIVTFTGLDLGYYLVDTTLGTLCGLDTTNTSVTIKEKNEAPIIKKEVEEDSKTENAWGATNDADIGQTVNFKITVTAKKGAENYVVHDVMSTGLTLKSDSIVVKVGTTPLTKDTDYTVTLNAKHGEGEGETTHTFDIAFKVTYLDTIVADTTIVITYSATLNDQAVVGLNGNPNKTWLDYADSSNTTSTPESTTTTYTWDLDIFKYTEVENKTVEDGEGGDQGAETPETKKLPLVGVKFVLLNSGGTKVAAVASGKITGWMTIPTGESTWPEGTSTVTGYDGKSWPAASVLITGTDGKICIDGLDADSYKLLEIEALPGYNVLAGAKDFTITGATKAEGSDTLTYTTVLIEVENKSGTKLPSTGSTGTTLFISFGSIVALIAVVFMITRKKMSVYED